MDIKTLQNFIGDLFETHTKIVPFLWGLHGTGKSQVIEGICKERGWKMQDFRLNLMADEGDIIGLQDFIKDADGNSVAVAHMMPAYLREMFEFCKANPDKRGVLFFDEVNRANRFSIIGVLFQMTTARRLHLWDFPENLCIILAGNPDTEDYTTLNIEDKALLDRFLHIKFTPKTAEFHSFAEDKEIDMGFLNFFKEQPGCLESSNLSTFDVAEYASPSRRSVLEVAYPIYSMFKEGRFNEGTLQELMLGCIGGDATSAFLAYQRNLKDHPVTPEDIIKGTKKEMTRLAKLRDDGRIDVLRVTCDNLFKHVSRGDEIADMEYKKLVDFMLEYAPADLAAAYIDDMCTEKFAIVQKSTGQYRMKELTERLLHGTK